MSDALEERHTRFKSIEKKFETIGMYDNDYAQTWGGVDADEVEFLVSELKAAWEREKIYREALERYASYPEDILYFDPTIKTKPHEILAKVQIPIAKHAREALNAAEELK